MIVKLLNFYTADGDVHIGASDGEKIVDVSAVGYSWGWQEIFSDWERIAPQIESILQHAKPLAHAIRFAPAVTAPGKILCVGLNYASHRAEVPFGAPKYPALFSKFSNALNAVGRRIKDAAPDEAAAAIFGYTAGNDFTARDLQRRTSQWLLGKTPDGFAPLGPYIVPAAEIDISCLAVQTFVNGKMRQDGTTADMIFSPAEIVSYISKCMTLEPGDVIFTGTPHGVIFGLPEKERVWLKAGDEVVVKIEGIGELRNVIA